MSDVYRPQKFHDQTDTISKPLRISICISIRNMDVPVRVKIGRPWLDRPNLYPGLSVVAVLAVLAVLAALSAICSGFAGSCTVPPWLIIDLQLIMFCHALCSLPAPAPALAATRSMAR